jgi:plasmid stabilization system protein ParE
MSYGVRWQRRAKAELADVWLNAADRNEVTAAAHRVEQLLRRDPLTAGESRTGRLRLVFDGPIAVLYHVDPQARRVAIISVDRAGP